MYNIYSTGYFVCRFRFGITGMRREMISRQTERTLFIVVVFVLLVAVVILSLIEISGRIVLQLCKNENEDPVIYDDVDVAIIGAGLSGTYTAWKLRESKGLRIGLFEYSDRIGGQMYTREFPGGVNVELGANEFMYGLQERMAKIVNDLNLTLQSARGSVEESTIHHYLRGSYISHANLQIEDIPFNIPGANGTFREHIINKVLRSINKYGADLMKWTLTDGTPLYKCSWRRLLRRLFSQEEYAALYQLMFPFHALYEQDVSAVVALQVLMQSSHGVGGFMPNPCAASYGYCTIKGGMQSLPETLVKQFTQAGYRNKVHLQNKLISMNKWQNGKYLLTFETGQAKTPVKATVLAKRVILAIAPSAVKQLNWEPLTTDQNLQHHLSATCVNPLFKMYLQFNKNWWFTTKLNNIKSMLSDTPMSQTINYNEEIDSNGEFQSGILLAPYCDSVCFRFWQPLLEGAAANFSLPNKHKNTYSVTRELFYSAVKQLAELYNVTKSDIPEPEAATAHAWQPDLQGFGHHLYRPGYNWTETMQFMAKPLKGENIHFIGSSYASGALTVLAEGALETADNFLKNHMGFSLED